MHPSPASSQQTERDREIARLERELRVQPRDANSRAQLALLLRDAGLPGRAESEARLAVQADPSNAYAHHVLGLVFHTLRKFELSEQALTVAARLAPMDASVWNNLGRTYLSLGHIARAIAAYRQAVAHAPDSALYHANLAGALVENSEHDASVAHYQAATRLAPGDPEYWSHLGQVYDELRRHDEAEQCFRRALACDAAYPEAHVHLLIHHPGSVTDADIATCHALLDSPRVDGAERANLLFALAQTADRARDFDRAADLMQRANAAKHRWNQSLPEAYAPLEYERLVDVVIETFTADFLRERADWGNPSEVPLFVFGLPRSGTTLTEQFLAAHPGVHGAGELRLGSGSFAYANEQSESYDDMRARLQSLTAGDVRSIADAYLAQLRPLAPDAARIVDKMPENYLYAGWLALLFPRARFVCCLRDFRDVALSAMITSFRHVQWSNSREQLLHRFAQFRRLHDHWQQVLAGRMLTVRYDETIAAPEAAARALVAWAGLPWDDACLDHRNSDARIRSASLSQARQPIYRSSVGRWRNYAPYLPGFFEQAAAIDPIRHDDANP